MRAVNPRGLAPIAVSLLAVLVVVGMSGITGRPKEPEWEGHRLGEWLGWYDSSLHFDPGDGLYPPRTGAEIYRALDGIGTRALPFLKEWLMVEPARFKPWWNAQMATRGWIRLRFATDEIGHQMLAERGFQYYGTDAQSLLPWLLEFSTNPDPRKRALAYEAAFFTRPDREIFLSLADRALRDDAAGCGPGAAQWMAERFPAEAARRNLPFEKSR
jgi:hypothetical protein